MQNDDAPARIGEILAGKYRVEKILGEGAMGVVVAAMHLDLAELRAIKFMLPSKLDDGEGVERFLREARAAARLKSQHAAKVHDVGRLENGSPYIVMEHLDGSDLKRILGADATLPVPVAVEYVKQACEAIGEAHAAGIVHRDLKPANLFLTTGVGGAPCIKVLDFGIAKMSSGGESMEVTRTTQLLGTPLYMSPEQMRSTRNVDARTDVWSLGVILYRMLVGRTPFVGSTVTEICSAVVADVPDPPSSVRHDLPAGLEAIVMRCLEKSPARRFANAGELATALTDFARGAEVPAVSRDLGGPRSQPVEARSATASAPAPVSAATTARAVPQKAVLAATLIGAPSLAEGASGETLVAEAPVATTLAARQADDAVRASAPGSDALPHAVGQTTAQGMMWVQPGAQAPAPRRRGMLIAAAGLIVSAGVVAIVFATTGGQAPAAATKTADALATTAAPSKAESAAPITTTPPPPTSTEAASVTETVASSAPTPATTSGAHAEPTLHSPPVPHHPTPQPVAPGSKDAFGHDRH